MDAPRSRRLRGPFSRWPRTADGALALAMALLSVVVVEGPGDSLGLRGLGDVAWPVLALSAFAGAALWWRRRRPRLVLAVVLSCSMLALVSGEAELGGPAIVALYSMGRYAASSRWDVVGVVGAILVVVVDGLLDPVPWGEVLFGAVVMEVAWSVGRRIRMRAERIAEQVRERAAEQRRIVVEERTRIARELHDVVAHRVSAMTVQAGAAKVVAATDLDGAVRAMAAVEQTGRQALDELRHLLDVLRVEIDPDGHDPQPGLAEVPALVQQTRDAGVDVTLAMPDPPPVLPSRVDLSAYRIVQESLTNVLRHAGPGATAVVRVATDGGRVRIEVADDGAGHRPAAQPVAGAVSSSVHGPGSGHGIVGMRERAALLGGTLDVGPGPAGGFRVVADLPSADLPAAMPLGLSVSVPKP